MKGAKACGRVVTLVHLILSSTRSKSCLQRNSVVPPMPEWMADLARRGGDFPGATGDDDAKEKAERDARWVGEWSDDLTVAIALKEWTKAVDLVEQGM